MAMVAKVLKEMTSLIFVEQNYTRPIFGLHFIFTDIFFFILQLQVAHVSCGKFRGGAKSATGYIIHMQVK